VIIVGSGNTAMDAAHTASRLGGKASIVYRRAQSEMPARSRNCTTRSTGVNGFPTSDPLRLTRSSAITPVFWLPRSSC
jgi:NADPH-dependent glutamate synthase beta subunit-like oxidoreductase